MKKQLLAIIDTVQSVNGSRNWILYKPITVRLSEMDNHLMEIHALCVSPSKKLFIMDGNGQWEMLDDSGIYSDKIITSISERVNAVYGSKVKEVAS